MNTNGNYTPDEIRYLDPKILTEALNLFQQLITWVDNDVFTENAKKAPAWAGVVHRCTRTH